VAIPHGAIAQVLRRVAGFARIPAATLFALALVLAVGAAARAQKVEPRAAAEPIMKQLDAFKRDDYDAAYAFASAEIRELFDRSAFERMVKTAYPEIARSTYALVAGTQEQPDGHVVVRVRIRGANGNSIEALYDMVNQADGWRINGVATRPDQGLI
jgi:Domain of unknown function (DUF4864)